MNSCRPGLWLLEASSVDISLPSAAAWRGEGRGDNMGGRHIPHGGQGWPCPLLGESADQIGVSGRGSGTPWPRNLPTAHLSFRVLSLLPAPSSPGVWEPRLAFAPTATPHRSALEGQRLRTFWAPWLRQGCRRPWPPPRLPPPAPPTHERSASHLAWKGLTSGSLSRCLPRLAPAPKTPSVTPSPGQAVSSLGQRPGVPSERPGQRSVGGEVLSYALPASRRH